MKIVLNEVARYLSPYISFEHFAIVKNVSESFKLINTKSNNKIYTVYIYKYKIYIYKIYTL